MNYSEVTQKHIVRVTDCGKARMYLNYVMNV